MLCGGECGERGVHTTMEGQFQVVCVQGRQYRKQMHITQLEGHGHAPPQQEQQGQESGSGSGSGSGGQEVRVMCPQAMVRFVVGRERANVRRMEEKTGARIQVPVADRRKNSPTTGHTQLIISGPSEQAVLSGKREVEECLRRHLHLVEPTHFVSIPLRSVQLAERVEELMETLHKDYGIDTSLYMPVKKLHLTLQVCKLFSEEQVRKCVECVEAAVSRFQVLFQESNAIHHHATLSHEWSNRIHFSGLNYMGDDPRSTNVLYLHPEPSLFTQQLDRLATILTESLVEEGLLEESKRERKLLLHATLCNIRYSSSKCEGMDVERIMQDLGDHDLCEVEVDEVCLAEIKAVDPVTGFYKVIHSTKLVDTSVDLSQQ